jgi:hypothetical protein
MSIETEWVMRPECLVEVVHMPRPDESFHGFGARGRKVFAALLLLVILTLIVACASLIDSPAFQTAQSAKLASELEAVSRKTAERKRLFYIGLALFPEKWSENDVVDLGSRLRQVSDYDIVSLMASNVIVSLPETYPVADDSAIEALVAGAAEQASDNDLVFVYISTHGNRGALQRKIGTYPEQIVSASRLAQLLQPLTGRRTVIFLSACFSGSLLAELKSEDRIIVTAARADRASFGCRPAAQHTYFGEAVLRSFGQRDRSLQQIVADIRTDVAAQERAHGQTPSEPQVYVGQHITTFYTEPVF